MDDRARKLAVRKEDIQVSSGVVTSSQSAPSDANGITTGVLLEGKYLVGRILGAGAVGIVYEAVNVELDERVAIKCLRPEMMAEEGIVGRFAREAKAAAGLKSEYVAHVFDVGNASNGMPYIVMEYLEGKNLAELVEESGTIGPRTAVEYALQVCEALALAHSRGIVHRDIKPENLLLCERAGGMKIIKVLDFGISKAALEGNIFKSAIPLVKTVNLMGTPLYMSPEQVRVTDSVDVRSDIWSLGMVMYEMLTGQTAFDGQSITEICAQILETKPKPLEVYRNDLPAGLIEVIAKCLNKNVNDRYQNVAELALALMPFGPKRTRLNVERAVAVLQGSGHLPAHIQVNSTMPPSSGSDYSLTPIPRAPSLPTDTLSSGIPRGASMSPAGVSAPPGTRSMSSPAYQAPPEKKKPMGIIIGAVALVSIAAGVGAFTFGQKKDAPASTTPSSVATTETKAAPPAPVTATATPTAATPAPEATAETSAPGSATRVVNAPIVNTPRNIRVPVAAPPKPASAASMKAKSGAKLGEEPDLGY